MSSPASFRAHLERLDHDVVRLIAHRDERYQRAVGADLGIVARLHRAYYGNVSGAGIHHQQMLFVRRESQRIGMAAYLHSADHAALVNGIDADGVRSEIAHVQQTVVGGTYLIGNNPVRGIVSSDNSLLYVSNFGSDTVSVYAIDQGRVIGAVQVGSHPDALALTPDEEH